MRKTALTVSLATYFWSCFAVAQTAPAAPSAPSSKPSSPETPQEGAPKAEAAPKESAPPKDKTETPPEEPAPKATPSEQPDAAAGAAAPAAAESAAPAAAAQEETPATGSETAGASGTEAGAEAPPASDTASAAPEAPKVEQPEAATAEPPKEAPAAGAAPRSATARPETPEESANDAGLVADKKNDPLKRFSLGIMIDMSVPVGNTASFIGSAGLQGFSVDLRYFVNDNLGVGLGAGFDGLSKKLEGTFVWDNLVVDGIHTRQANFTPLVAKAIYRFPGQGILTPYLAGGFGAARASERILVGVTTLSRDSWHMALVPEAGVHLKVSKATLLGAVKFNYLPGTKSAESQSFVNVSVGVAIQ